MFVGQAGKWFSDLIGMLAVGWLAFVIGRLVVGCRWASRGCRRRGRRCRGRRRRGHCKSLRSWGVVCMLWLTWGTVIVGGIGVLQMWKVTTAVLCWRGGRGSMEVGVGAILDLANGVGRVAMRGGGVAVGRGGRGLFALLVCMQVEMADAVGGGGLAGNDYWQLGIGAVIASSWLGDKFDTGRGKAQRRSHIRVAECNVAKKMRGSAGVVEMEMRMKGLDVLVLTETGVLEKDEQSVRFAFPQDKSSIFSMHARGGVAAVEGGMMIIVAKTGAVAVEEVQKDKKKKRRADGWQFYWF